MTFLWFKYNDEQKVSEKINLHNKIVLVSKSIGDYTKRAEKHLYMFLMLNNENHKYKYLKNLKNLQGLVETLTEFEKNNKQNTTAIDLKQSVIRLINHGNTLLLLYESRSQDFNVFLSKEFIEKVSQIHESSNIVRNLALLLISSSSDLLKSEGIIIEENVGIKNNLLIVFSILINFLIFMVFYQAVRIRAHKNKMNALSELTFIDSLTGIGNRRKFDNEFEKQWKISTRTGKSFYLLMLDIDYFKKFNDYYGHTEGDRCLKKVSHLLRNMVSRQSDTVCRYGGEEFAIIMSESSNVVEVAEKCRKGIEALKIANKNSTISEYLTLSIGVGEVIGTLTENYSDGIKRIDIALYLAKRQGRNQVVNV